MDNINNLAKTLNQIGLSEKEAVVYEALLSLGKAGMGKLLTKVPYKRGNTYDLVNELIKKGLISETEEKGKMVFQAEPPVMLERLVEQQAKTIEQQKQILADNIERLNSVYNLTVARPVIKYFEGIEGFKKIYEETLRHQDKEISVFRSIFDSDKMHDYLISYGERRAKLGIITKIFSPTEVTDETAQEDKNLLKERKYLPKEIFNLPSEIDIFHNKVAILSYREKLIGAIIENKDFADSMRTIFSRLWEKTT